ncbi:MAG TPA: lysylphosphatidylglycerol synthase transmembrane domain-containing protein [Dehalococcoidia bacterium]|nr:lysylphosphatidylglycerol synthase transmembrane domain-containing protein [Dehalococcoidia bacterium]
MRFRSVRTLLALQLLLSIGTLALLFWRVDIVGAVRQLPDVRYGWLVPGLLMFTASKGIHAYRWRYFLRHHEEIPTRHLFALFLVSNLANAVIPFRAGDLLRIELPNRRFGVARAEMASTVLVVESLLDGVTFVILLTTGIALLDLPEVLRSTLLTLAVIVLSIFAVTVLAARYGTAWDPTHSRVLRPVPARARPFIGRRFVETVAGLASLRTTSATAVAIGISICAWVTEVGVYWFIGHAFGLGMTVAEALVVTIAANLAVAVPVTPWNVGPYEVVVTEALVAMGAPRDTASGYAIGSHLLLLAWIGVTGFVAMWSLDLSLRDLVHRSAQAPPAA